MPAVRFTPFCCKASLICSTQVLIIFLPRTFINRVYTIQQLWKLKNKFCQKVRFWKYWLIQQKLFGSARKVLKLQVKSTKKLSHQQDIQVIMKLLLQALLYKLSTQQEQLWGYWYKYKQELSILSNRSEKLVKTLETVPVVSRRSYGNIGKNISRSYLISRRSYGNIGKNKSRSCPIS